MHSAKLRQQFSDQLIRWHATEGRHGLPWQGVRDPYAVWVSEIMLQQTQVATVLERYPRMIKRFPTVKHLADADIDDVLAEWSGLGYYSRARNLHACAKQIVNEYDGQFPSDPALLEQLSGIGKSTAGAIAAFAFQQRAPILDANVKRVLARLFGITEALQEKATTNRLWNLADELLPQTPKQMPVYTQALMDFGATWCTAKTPVCITKKAICPFEGTCKAKSSDQVLAIPKKVTKPKSPHFQCHVGLFLYQNQVLLQKRPAKAIWGGLWSLPESAWEELDGIKASPVLDSSSAIHLLLKVLPDWFGENAAWSMQCTVQLGTRFKHVFSHRILHIQPSVLELDQNAKREFDEALQSDKESFVWARLDALDLYGLPQPIKRLLLGWNPVRDGVVIN